MVRNLALGVCSLVFVMLGATSCVVKTNQEWIRDAAARDLQCPKGQVTVHHYTETADRKGATGCGKTARFNRYCREDGWCSWKMEAPPQPAP